MASLSSRRMKNSLEALRAAGDIFSYVHPDYQYHKPDWDLIRDLLAGTRRVKEMGSTYLPPLGKDSGTTYENYKSRAVYVNMLARTVSGLLGTVFRRPIKLLGVSTNTRAEFDSVGIDGSDINLFAKGVASELFAMGRVGVLVDRDAEGVSPAYFAAYQPENILSWQTKIVKGRETLIYVLLREVVENMRLVLDGNINREVLSQPALYANYRVLRINEAGNYIQEIYKTNYTVVGSPTVSDTPDYTLRPTKNGQPLKEIPMKIIGPLSPSAAVQKSPIVDIAYMNLAHYQTSAQLEHGRYFTALPVYYVAKAPGTTEQAEYVVGPSVVWETAPGEKPGIIEFFGTGLKSLADSLIEKEEAISQLGGRIMGIRSAATSESEVIFKLKQANEMAVLINATESMAAAFTQLVRWRLDWDNNPDAKTAVAIFNQDFKSLSIGARELRALASLYQANILPIKEVYRVLQETEYISDDVTMEEFTAMLNDPAQFPNQPDVAAMREGYPDAASKIADKNAKAARELEAELADDDAIVRGELLDKKLAADKVSAREAAKAAAASTQNRPNAPPTAGPLRRPA